MPFNTWFGLHLRRGNSLIGARRAVHPRSEVSSKAWLEAIPKEVPLTSLVEDIEEERVGGGLGGAIHHFLLPADGWGSAVEAKEAVALAPERAKELKQWRSKIKAKPTRGQVDDLTELAHRVEVLWQFAFRRLEVAEREIRRSIPVWGADNLPVGGAVQREQIEAALADPNGAYCRLRLVMDAWCALWFWPLTDTLTKPDDEGAERIEPPTLVGWIAGLQAVLGGSPELRRPTQRGNRTLGEIRDWDELGQAEENELLLAGAVPIDTVLRRHPWLRVCRDLAQRQGFFHWGLDFAPVFAAAGGFDLQVGNPPWVRPRSDVAALLAESDPWWVLATKPTQAQIAEVRQLTLAIPGAAELVLDGTVDTAVLAELAGDPATFPHLSGQPDLYRCFMEQTWRHVSSRGQIGLIHLDTHFTDERAGVLREAAYRRLRRHWEFINELKLFEIQDQKHYGVNIYGSARGRVDFMNAVSLYHPDTVERSLVHDGSGPEPGLKDEEGNWDLRVHRNRLVTVTEDMLRSWHAMLESAEVPVAQTRMVYAVNRSVESVLDKLAMSPRIGELDLRFSRGWDESIDRKKGRFEQGWGVPASWDDVILQGPHLFVGNPFYKSPNPTMRNHLDWSPVDLETLEPDAIPATCYKPAGDRYTYDCAYTDWGDDDNPKPARDYYRVAWRRMAANTGERTLITAIIPPGSAHPLTIYSASTATEDYRQLLAMAGFMSSLLLDLQVRSANRNDIINSGVMRLASCFDSTLLIPLRLRIGRLNMLTDAYGKLWQGSFHDEYRNDRWTSDQTHLPALDVQFPDWTPSTPLREAEARRLAQVEIDALVALMLGVTADELCTIYRTQFPVLNGYDRNRDFYDANGRLVPTSVIQVWKRKGDAIGEDERTATNASGYTYTYELPFRTLDREHDMRVAYAEFERRLAHRS